MSSESDARTVVITGMGAITPLGNDVDTTWQAMLAGKSGVSTIAEDWVEELALPTKFAAQVDVQIAEEVLPRVQARRMDRSSQLAVGAAVEAWKHAGYGVDPSEHGLDRDRLAVSVGTGIGGLNSLISNWDVLNDRGVRRVSPFTIPMLMANAPASQVGLRIGARAGVHTPVSACASSNEAIAQGLEIVRNGRADVCVVGGTEAVIHPLPIAAFGQMQALSRRNDAPEQASRPWDVDRDGFVLGEGAVVLVLETLEHARARGATIHGTVAGMGMSADSHDIVQPDPSGYGQRLAMKNSLADAGLEPGQVNHVNAHGTSTPQGDATEAASIRTALGEKSEAVVTSTKSMTGHLLGGAGAVESLATVLALKNRTVPPTINVDNLEERLGIDIAANKPRELPAGDLAGLNNSFGFGGPNVAIAFTNQNVTEGA